MPDGEYDGNNGSRDDGGPYYSIIGAQGLQRDNTSVLFLYDGPNGLSLVTVHDMSGGDGGSATWTVTGVPSDADWVVKDDLYLDPDAGEPASSNYDRWYTDGTEHTIDWTWGGGGTDGGVLRPLGSSFSLDIDPAFNEQATLWDEYYEGDIVDWQFLSGSRPNPDRTSLSLDQPVTVSATDEDDGTPSEEHTLVFEGDGAKSTYEFSVSGEISGDETVQPPDSISGSSASGAVSTWKDVYTFTGDLVELSVTGGATVYLDDEPY